MTAILILVEGPKKGVRRTQGQTGRSDFEIARQLGCKLKHRRQNPFSRAELQEIQASYL